MEVANEELEVDFTKGNLSEGALLMLRQHAFQIMQSAAPPVGKQFVEIISMIGRHNLD